ncbi:antibiotic biosynthesis monooxygenase family protein [Ovoidimarina sediminis]|uniref:antibiotic biosynthesis monooxygenase family protein n=1 Tax=Ovoidimarina sediminis TaxID=3079856 RepID=UPI0029075833|nr:antibiotic biosynthesis monooxygenase [Rhodophyticola sp. MJ-SS7]MDU8944365.1 antibiotic biosynthesis monooxygenase [Rhodophyticola sp. MJ-SS7]
MIAIIFEVEPKTGMTEPYLDMAARMRPLAESIDGFISVERFQSLTNPEKLLSLSFWRDEAAVDEWRRLAEHRKAQTMGRTRFFDDYRLRVAHVLRDYGMTERDEAPEDSRMLHDAR